MGIENTEKGMVTKYGVMLRLELIPAGKTEADGPFQTQDVYFKILPKGYSDFKGLLLGYPALDHKTRGLGLQVTEKTHWMQRHDVHLPRIELERRRARDKEYETWERTGDYVSLMTEGVRRLKEFAVLGEMAASSLNPDFVVPPGNSAVVPVVWQGQQPSMDFLCDSPSTSSCRTRRRRRQRHQPPER